MFSIFLLRIDIYIMHSFCSLLSRQKKERKKNNDTMIYHHEKYARQTHSVVRKEKNLFGSPEQSLFAKEHREALVVMQTCHGKHNEEFLRINLRLIIKTYSESCPLSSQLCSYMSNFAATNPKSCYFTLNALTTLSISHHNHSSKHLVYLNQNVRKLKLLLNKQFKSYNFQHIMNEYL